jgi:glycosyltransferase involved in cell wall biosynthesis/peptidoglycan/xylan/chitin deacetylase (PgdA/CDA1 family)
VPEISVVIPTHNRQDLLRRCLQALERQTLGPDAFEVIVADDGSTDGSAEMAEGLSTPFRLQVLRLEKSGKPAARNAGIEAAKGAVCVFVDDDVVVSPEFVGAHLAAHRGGEPIIGIGALTQRPPAARDWYAHAFAKAWNDHYGQLTDRTPSWSDCYGANMSVARSTLLEVDGFSGDFPTAQDTELAFRLWSRGCVPTHVAGAKGVHDDQKRCGRMLQDARRIGADSIRLIAAHPSTLPSRLGGFNKAPPRDLALRRALLSLRVPPRLLAAAGRLIPGSSRKQFWYYFVARYTFWLGVRESMPRSRWAQTTRGIPILMYHAFSDDGGGSRYIQTKRSFARQMRWLRLLRYKVVPLEELAEAIHSGRQLPRKAVVLTVDDGYEDNLDIARPILQQQSLPATIFLVSRLLGRSNEWSDGGATAGRPLFSVEQARQAQGNGLEFGAHTRHHRRLPDVDDAAVREEVEGSREDLESLLERPVRTFAYPYGGIDDRAMAAAKGAGFEIALSVDNRRATIADDTMRVPRIEICGTDSLPRFLRKVWLGNI